MKKIVTSFALLGLMASASAAASASVKGQSDGLIDLRATYFWYGDL